VTRMGISAVRRGCTLLVVLSAAMAWLAPTGTIVNGQEPSVPLTNTVTEVALKSQPVTVTLSPSLQLKPALTAADLGRATVALAVEAIRGTLTQPVRVNVFVNRPDADRTTPLEDPHFLGYINVQPTRGRVENAGRLFDVPANAIGDLIGAVRVTLVPVVGLDDAPRDAALQVGRIYMRREN
jgi:hypothetical protein